MKIAVDARWIFPEISGIGAYTLHLLANLPLLDAQHEYLAVFREPAMRDRLLASPALARTQGRLRTCLAPYSLFSARNQWALPALLQREKVDVYHTPNYMMPLWLPLFASRRIRCAATIHDVIPLAFPNHAPQSRKARLFPIYRWLMREVGRRADAILTVSRASARDIEHYLRIPPGQRDKIRVVYNGVSDLFRPRVKPRNEVKTILYVGRQDPYKNVCGLIRIFAEVRRRMEQPVQLTIAGADDPRYPEWRQLARELKVDQEIVCTGYLDHARLVEVYAGADVLAHASKYEGFGLQILEAMASGLPVVASNRSSLPEVVGNAALLVDPDDSEVFADAIVRTLTQPDLADELARLGIARASEFSWTQTARKTLLVYESLMKEPT